MKKVAILGTRGIPAQHGGFETFAEYLALHLARRGYAVSVYCQADGSDAISERDWSGIRLIDIPTRRNGAVGTMEFDWKSIGHVLGQAQRPLALTLGYNTASFSFRYRLAGVRQLINMDGIEWKREKWSLPARAWLWLNERLGCWLANHLIADHPEIANHLASRVSRDKITTIPYGAPHITDADIGLLRPLQLEAGRYALVIARPEPENSILDIVKAFSRRRRGMKLVVLGSYDPASKPFHAAVKAAASEEVLFPGAIYERPKVEALRFFARLYVHGHRVGGTNPSLVEALGCGSAVLAHDNRFNRWVAGEQARYFQTEEDCAAQLDEILQNDDTASRMRQGSHARFLQEFTWDAVLERYEQLIERWL
jgi:glycosyltransferase involved in cell wall biosynthesis